MLSGLVNRFRAKGLTARAAVADSSGAAHALARADHRETIIAGLGTHITDRRISLAQGSNGLECHSAPSRNRPLCRGAA